MDLIKIIHSEKLYLQRIVNNISAINSSFNWFDYKNSFTNHLSTHLFIHLYSVNMNHSWWRYKRDTWHIVD